MSYKSNKDPVFWEIGKKNYLQNLTVFTTPKDYYYIEIVFLVGVLVAYSGIV